MHEQSGLQELLADNIRFAVSNNFQIVSLPRREK